MPRLRRMLQNHKKALAVGMQLDGSDAVAPPIPFETIMASLGALTASENAAVAACSASLLLDAKRYPQKRSY